MMLDPSLVARAERLRARLERLRVENERAQAELIEVVAGLAAEGGTLREIADLVGLSHQRVHQLVGQSGETMLSKLKRRRGRRPGAPGALERLSVTARVGLELAQEEATALGHDFIGTEHLLLGLLRADQSLAQALAPRLTADAVRTAIIDKVGKAQAAPARPAKRVLPRLKLALERALRESERAGHQLVGPRELVLGIITVEESVGAQILADGGFDYAELRAAAGDSDGAM